MRLNMIDVYRKYMHKIGIAITTRLQDQGEGLIMLPNESVANSIPQQEPAIAQQRSASPDILVISSTLSQARLNIFYHQTEVKYP